MVGGHVTVRTAGEERLAQNWRWSELLSAPWLFPGDLEGDSLMVLGVGGAGFLLGGLWALLAWSRQLSWGTPGRPLDWLWPRLLTEVGTPHSFCLRSCSCLGFTLEHLLFTGGDQADLGKCSPAFIELGR